jgi:enoyl-CoA hydratase
MFTSEVISIELDGHVGILWLDSPERRNAMGHAFWEDLPRAMSELSGDEEVRCVVVMARGSCFTVGLDLKDAFLAQTAVSDASSSPAAQSLRRYREIKRLQAAISSVADCPKPTIAAVHGYCIGGGVDLVSACDIRLASSDATFSVRETRMAIVADLGTLQRLPRIVGSGHVAELVYTGADIGAQRASEIGMVNRVFGDVEQLQREARAMASAIASNSPLVVQGANAVMRASEGRPVAEGLDFVAAWNAGMLVSSDLMEAMAAFAEKRPAVFKGF